MDLHYTVTSSDRHDNKQDWTVQAFNNDYSIPWGLGHFINGDENNDKIIIGTSISQPAEILQASTADRHPLPWQSNGLIPGFYKNGPGRQNDL